MQKMVLVIVSQEIVLRRGTVGKAMTCLPSMAPNPWWARWPTYQTAASVTCLLSPNGYRGKLKNCEIEDLPMKMGLPCYTVR